MSVGALSAFYAQEQYRFFYIKVNDQRIQSSYGTDWRIWAAWHQLKYQFQRCCSNLTMIGGDRETEHRETAISKLNALASDIAITTELEILTAPSFSALKTYQLALSKLLHPSLQSTFKQAQAELGIREAHLKRMEDLQSLPLTMRQTLYDIQNAKSSVEDRLTLIRTLVSTLVDGSPQKTICLNEIKIGLDTILKDPSLKAMSLERAIKLFSEMHDVMKQYSDDTLINRFSSAVDQYSVTQSTDRKEHEEKAKEEERIPDATGKLIHERITKQLDHLRTLHDIVESLPEAIDTSETMKRLEIARVMATEHVWSRIFDPATKEINGEITVGLQKLFVERNAKSKKITVLQFHGILGEGGSGTAYKVYDFAAQRFGAMKQGRLVHAEARNLARLREMGIRGVQPPPYLVTVVKKMRFFNLVEEEAMVGTLYRGSPGRIPDLFDVLKYQNPTHEQKLSYLVQVIGQYQQFRGKVYHRDIKPENLFTDVDVGTATLGDWAAMKEFADGIPQFTPEELSRDMTPEYTPLSVIKDLQSTNQETRNIAAMFHDRFAIGSILYIIITGEPPYYTNRHPYRFGGAGLVNAPISPQLKQYLKEMCSLVSPKTTAELREQDRRLDALLEACVKSGELPPIPTY